MKKNNRRRVFMPRGYCEPVWRNDNALHPNDQSSLCQAQFNSAFYNDEYPFTVVGIAAVCCNLSCKRHFIPIYVIKNYSPFRSAKSALLHCEYTSC